jgi:hypothetical protein
MAITKLNSLAIPDDTIVEADLSYPLTNFSSTGIDDNATSTAVTIDASQNVGIGTTSPGAKLDVNGDVKVLAADNTSARTIYLGPSDFASSTKYLAVQWDQQNSRALYYTQGAYPHTFWTNNAERMRILSSGGITFNGDTAAANALDDYEEGSFTPIAFGGTSAGTATYSLQSGTYRKIGSLVHVQITIGWSGHTGTGNLNIGGLPFTSLSGAQGQSTLSTGYNNGLSFTSGNAIGNYVSANNTKIVMVQWNNSGSVSVIPVDSAVTELIIAGTYISS